MQINVINFYKIKKINKPEKYKSNLKKFFLNHLVKGIVILSQEGISGTISGKRNNVKSCIYYIKKKLSIKMFDSSNYSKIHFHPFFRTKIKIKKEVVPIGIKVINRKTKNHVEPENWNEIIKDKNTFLIDARKPFEYGVGTFKRSINPNVKNFKEFPNYLKTLDKSKTIAMFCTGGIRCEKASIFLEKKGFKNVFQLKGGILNYLKKIKKRKSLWKGECYVFDNRVSLKHDLAVGSYSICSGCRNPISHKEKMSKKYEEGVSCPRCHSKLTTAQRARFRMRQKQINLAKKAGKKHIFQKEF